MWRTRFAAAVCAGSLASTAGVAMAAPVMDEPEPAISAETDVLEGGDLQLPRDLLVTPPPDASDDALGELPDEDLDASAHLPTIYYGDEDLPEAVRDVRTRLLEAARSGDPQQLQVVIDYVGVAPAAIGPVGLDISGLNPLDQFTLAVGEGSPQELLAILIESLEAGYLHIAPGTPDEMYLWPYFASYPLDALTPAQEVELFEIVTSFDLEAMREFGAYNFYRLGIDPDGVWQFFVTGD